MNFIRPGAARGGNGWRFSFLSSPARSRPAGEADQFRLC